MIQIIEMAKHYKKLPSEIVRIQNDYDAFCFDEICYFYEVEAIEKDGTTNWDKLTFIDDPKNDKDTTNADFKDFIKKTYK